MAFYTATIAHHSISRAREIKINGTLEVAKRRATKEFGDGFIDHEIIIREDREEGEVIARRKIGERNWRS